MEMNECFGQMTTLRIFLEGMLSIIDYAYYT